jgi:hypothetical protein
MQQCEDTGSSMRTLDMQQFENACNAGGRRFLLTPDFTTDFTADFITDFTPDFTPDFTTDFTTDFTPDFSADFTRRLLLPRNKTRQEPARKAAYAAIRPCSVCGRK